jgi:RHS repeat-associated protein
MAPPKDRGDIASVEVLRQQRSSVQDEPEKQTSKSLPTVSLPKGGGAIRGIGEKFTANPVTGTGSLSVPIATSPGRSGFGPQFSLSYDSGGGNGPFGFGWSLSIPTITRKTDKGLPQYRDAEESDVYILSGAEDLVPVLEPDGTRFEDDTSTPGYVIHRYRPRNEGLFARIERWINIQTNEIHWRSISKDNITTVYGKTTDSRIEDPQAPEGSPRVFSWLICESYDDKGNAIYYEYERENSKHINLSFIHERNRTDRSRSASRYLKRIKYGNKTPIKHDSDLPREFREDLSERNDWLFEVVFDYDEGHYEELPTDANGRQFVNAHKDPTQDWQRRQDPFSSFRAGFEVRTYRLCHRILMFHHFPDELGVDDYLVRSTGFKYKGGPISSFITSVTQSGYKRQNNVTYLKKSLPPVEFEYSEATIQDKVEDVGEKYVENLPQGLDGVQYQWTDIDGEGLSGILTEQADSWFYKRNVSALPVVGADGKTQVIARFAPTERLATIPSFINLSEGRQQLLDLAGDGQLDVVEFDSPTPGFYERPKNEAWHSFKPFLSLPNVYWQDPNLKFVDLTGDGHADILITEDEAFTWYQSLAEVGFASGERVRQALDEEKGPKLVFADNTQSIYLADISGDGLTDLVRIRNGEVCYWPNLGYCRFGAKITMDHAPHFDNPGQFDHKRIRLADIDGSGTTDIIYLHRDGVRLYFNQSGNTWSEPQVLSIFPRIDELVSIMTADLLGNGTACLVWSSPLPSDAQRQMRYVNLMGGQKPHLLTKTVNNLGAETHIQYAPSTKFYLQDKRDGKPWITRLSFPVHVVERVEIYDHISHNRFVTRYAYHHGYFDGEEREFRGFGMVEQWDTEEFATLTSNDTLPEVTNIDAASHVPPVLTKTWFHTGAYLARNHISNFFAGLLDTDDIGEYYREPGLTDTQAQMLLLPDTVLPPGLTPEEEREACRSLKGAMLRHEVYALDGTPKAEFPYTVTEQNFTIRCLQPHNGNRYAVFFTHPHEAINYHYERNSADPRIQHTLTLEVDNFGNVQKQAAISYGRRENIRIVEADGQVREVANPDLDKLEQDDQKKQTQLLVTYSENDVTNAIDLPADDPGYDPDNYRTPLPCETRTYELTGYPPTGAGGRYQHTDFVQPDPNDPGRLIHILESEVDYEDSPTNGKQRRLIEHLRILYRPNDLGVSLNDPMALLPLGTVESLALPGETYKLAFTPGLLAKVYQRQCDGQPRENLLPEPNKILPVDLLNGQAADRGGYVDLDGNGHWWIPTGRVFYSPKTTDSAAQERAYAQSHFFLPRRYRDPFYSNHFKTESFVEYDTYDLLTIETRDALGNRVTVGERKLDDTIDPAKPGNDYRVLQPRRVMDPNRNRTEVVFDALGLVAGTAVIGKPEDNPQQGDLLNASFKEDLSDTDIDAFYDAIDPHVLAENHFKTATTRIIYDMDRFHKTRQAHPEEPEKWEPVFAAILAHETHVSDLKTNEKTKIQISFSYSDGFGREIQKKIQAEGGPLVDDGPIVSLRWVGNGWTIFNNKGKPVRQYEPFFSQLPEKRHRFEFGAQVGVSTILLYDPVERVVATLHPNYTYEKVVFDPWRQTTWDVNDTVLSDPRTDDDIRGYTTGYFASLPASPPAPPWQTWYQQRQGGALGAQEQAAAEKAAAHADTPTTAYFDTLGRPFLTVVHNKVVCPNHALDGTEDKFCTRVELDIEGNQRKVTDAKDRIVMHYDYSIVGPEQDENGESTNANLIHQASMEAGERWMLNDVAGNPIRAWDSRLFLRRMTYDELRRSVGLYVTENGVERLAERTVYGEGQGDANNHRTRVYQIYDGAGIVTNAAYDFKGNLLEGQRDLQPKYNQRVNWLLNPAANDGSFTSSTTYDALNRPLTVTSPDSSVYRPTFNEANLLDKVDVNLRGEKEPNGTLKWTSFVVNIDYNAKGQRELIVYGNGATTAYTYDEPTFRLMHLKTTRPAGLNGLASQIFAVPTVVQDLRYTYDPVGNITQIEDAALKTIVHDGQQVEPVCHYTYDALYRLIEARGREHIGQTAFDFDPPNDDYRDYHFVGHRAHPNDLQAMRNYIERYEYDVVGNFDVLRHIANGGSWTRRYDYDEASLIESTKQSNRLSSTTVGSDPTLKLVHDVHGNIIRMPHLGGTHPEPNMHWDFEDQLQQVDLKGGGTAYYVYDAGGQRMRKVVHRQNGKRKQERLYLGGFEIYREYKTDGVTKALERETLHIMDDKQRIALVETKTMDTADNTDLNVPMIRYQLGNHLGSASLELDENAEIISYEEYHPYGTTAFQAGRSTAEVSLKRYRYTGKERDEESGLYYHGARYYAPWLGRWCSCDPIPSKPPLSMYAFVKDCPILYIDPDGRKEKKMDPEVLREIAYEARGYAEAEKQRHDESIIKCGIGVYMGGWGKTAKLDLEVLKKKYEKEGCALPESIGCGTLPNIVLEKAFDAVGKNTNWNRLRKRAEKVKSKSESKEAKKEKWRVGPGAKWAGFLRESGFETIYIVNSTTDDKKRIRPKKIDTLVDTKKKFQHLIGQLIEDKEFVFARGNYAVHNFLVFRDSVSKELKVMSVDVFAGPKSEVIRIIDFRSYMETKTHTILSVPYRSKDK